MMIISIFFTAFLFAIGLGMSGMTRPSKVIGFLELDDPSLAFVMFGAVTVFAVAYRLSMRLPRPLFGDQFRAPLAKSLDDNLIAGAVMFGIGWGVSGYCPGPAIVALASGSYPAAEVACAMVAGMLLFELKRS